MKRLYLVLLVGLSLASQVAAAAGKPNYTEYDFQAAASNGILWASALDHSNRYLNGWLAYADHSGPVSTQLIPETPNGTVWTTKNSGADNYPFMVLTSLLTDRTRFSGTMLTMLNNERAFASLGRMPSDYDLINDKLMPMSSAERAFGASEYAKDGLMAITEWIGNSAWRDRMIEVTDETWTNYATLPNAFGEPMVSVDTEVNGDELEVLSRLYWMTGQAKYLDWAIRIGNHYLLGGHHPTDSFTSLRLRDHGSEIVGGLVELYITASYARPEVADKYRQHIWRMLDRILQCGRDADGFFYNEVNPQTGAILDPTLADTFGYVLDAFYSVYLLDGVQAYRDACRLPLNNLNKHPGSDFAEPMDGRADSVEGTLNIYNRESVGGADTWMDDSIQRMWAIQKSWGVVESWWGDGNFARTSIMYALWKSKGLSICDWRADVQLGAVQKDGGLIVSAKAASPWNGLLIFDQARHAASMNMPFDWPRINQFPEWFTIDRAKAYIIEDVGKNASVEVTGAALLGGYPLSLARGVETRLLVYVKPTTGDTQPPTVPLGVLATVRSDTRIDIRWLPSTDNVGVAGYEIRRDGSRLQTVAPATCDFSDLQLTPATYYSYQLIAFDAAGNRSSGSVGSGVSTLAAALPTVYSSTGFQPGNPPDHLLDGDPSGTSRWSVETYPQSVTLDYGSLRTFTGTRLYTYAARAYRFKVEYSASPLSGFVQCVDRTANTSASQPISDDFPPISARYLRLTVTGAFNYTGSWISLNEFQAAVPAPGPPVAPPTQFVSRYTGVSPAHISIPSGTRGLVFSTSRALTITHIARYCVGPGSGVPANYETHNLYVRNFNSGQDLAVRAISMAGCQNGDWVWAALDPPVVVPKGTKVYIASLESQSGDYEGGIFDITNGYDTSIVTGSAYEAFEMPGGGWVVGSANKDRWVNFKFQ